MPARRRRPVVIKFPSGERPPMATATGTDKEVGFAVAFAAVGVLGALVMVLASLDGAQLLAGWGFAVAMTAAALCVSVFHLYD